jgi:glutamate racemase
MACNTSSSVILDVVQQEYDFPILGLIKPASEYIASLDKKRFGVIATSATVKSNAYQKAINALDPNKEVYQVACPGLVEIVESGKIHLKESRKLISSYISPLMEKNVDRIVLGCTHYPYLADIIFDLTRNNELLVDPSVYIVKAAKDKLEKMDLLNNTGSGSRKYYVSSNPDMFVKVGSQFFSDCKKAELISFCSYIK